MTSTMTIASYVLVFTGGYVASIYTWPYIRATVLGVEGEVALLRDRVNAVLSAAKGK